MIKLKVKSYYFRGSIKHVRLRSPGHESHIFVAQYKNITFISCTKTNDNYSSTPLCSFLHTHKTQCYIILREKSFMDYKIQCLVYVIILEKMNVHTIKIDIYQSLCICCIAPKRIIIYSCIEFSTNIFHSERKIYYQILLLKPKVFIIPYNYSQVICQLCDSPTLCKNEKLIFPRHPYVPNLPGLPLIPPQLSSVY